MMAIKARGADVALPDRVFLDANVLLNAAFVRGGQADVAVSFALNNGHRLFVDEVSWRDAVRRSSAIAQKMSLTYDPEALLTQYVSALSILHVPPDMAANLQQVNKSDRPLANTTAAHEAWLLSDDHALIKELEGSPVKVETTGRLAGLALGGALPPPPSFPAQRRPSQASRFKRHLFMRLAPLGWANHNLPGKFTAFDQEGRLCLSYDNAAKRFNAVWDNGPSQSVSYLVSEGATCVVCATFDLSLAPGQRGKLALYVGPVVGVPGSNVSSLLGGKPIKGPQGPFRLTHDRSGINQWNGWFSAITASFGWLSYETFRDIAAVPYLTPSIEMGGILEHAMPLVARHPSGRLIPPSQDGLYEVF